MRIALAQIDTTVGDLPGNARRILDRAAEARAAGAELVVFPELALCGYPPRDLLHMGGFMAAAGAALEDLAAAAADLPPLLVGAPVPAPPGPGKALWNAAVLLRGGAIESVLPKRLLPTYDVFDEDRYFRPGLEPGVLELGGLRVGVTVCEDAWNDAGPSPGAPRYPADPVADLAARDVDLVVNLSASPYHVKKDLLRAELFGGLARRHGVPVVMVNAVGGNDELLFDGASLAFDASGAPLLEGPRFEEALLLVDPVADAPVPVAPCPDPVSTLRKGLVVGIRDYFSKCGFRAAVLGLSGGIDSAVTAALAAEALGPENVLGVTMPSRYSSEGSVADSEALARNLGIAIETLPIEEAFAAYLRILEGPFGDRPPNEAEENLQARVRGGLVMALSNKLGSLALTTGNKSELAVGYCTLYGDMCGGLAVISDVYKQGVYALARELNRDRERVPVATIEKPPSAELRPDQKDQDTLPPYEVLDAILKAFLEEHRAPDAIAAAGHDPDTVRWVIRRVILNEYKRRQAAPGLRISPKAFGGGRRMPVAQGYWP